MLSRIDWITAAIIAGTIGFVLVLYPQMPETVVVHYGMDGRPDKLGPREVIAFTPLWFFGFVAVLTSVLPRLSTGEQTVSPQVAAVLRRTVLLVMAAIHLWMMLTAMGRVSLPPNSILSIVGVLFVILGNYMGKVRRNGVIGIRTPWTLEDDDVWYRTHRMGGKLMLAGGLAIIVAGLLPISFAWTIATVLAVAFVIAVVPTVYSYRIRKRV